MLICNSLTGMRCAAEGNTAKYYFNSQLRAQKSKKKSKEMHYSGPCGRMMTKREIVYFSPRQAPLLNCFCIDQFPPDGKLDGKSMKHKAEKHLKHNKIQTML